MRFKGLVASLTAATILTAAAVAGEQSAETAAMEPAPKFTEGYLGDPANYQTGKEIWDEQCRHCHGRSAYPGKAPKLKPRRYSPDFVYDRVTNGFRKMPAWGEIFTQEERMSIVAYILSKEFSP